MKKIALRNDYSLRLEDIFGNTLSEYIDSWQDAADYLFEGKRNNHNIFVDLEKLIEKYDSLILDENNKWYNIEKTYIYYQDEDINLYVIMVYNPEELISISWNDNTEYMIPCKIFAYTNEELRDERFEILSKYCNVYDASIAVDEYNSNDDIVIKKLNIYNKINI